MVASASTWYAMSVSIGLCRDARQVDIPALADPETDAHLRAQGRPGSSRTTDEQRKVLVTVVGEGGGRVLRIGVLGATEIADGARVLPVPPPMPRALLALLALRPGSPVTVESIMDALWRDAPPETARNAIQ